MIRIVWAPPRKGKTLFLVYQAVLACFDDERNYLMQEAIRELNKNGFSLTIPEHAVSANFDLKLELPGYATQKARIINPLRLGFANDEVETHFNIPYETIIIQEAQRVFDSRSYKDFKTWQSEFYEQSGHNDINIWMDAQRPDLIDKNIRELASFIEIRNLEIKKHPNGRLERLTWTIRECENASALEKYKQSGCTDKITYTEHVVTTNINLFDLYDTKSCKPKFYDGHFNSDFDLKYGLPSGKTKEDYKRYMEEIKETRRGKKNAV